MCAFDLSMHLLRDTRSGSARLEDSPSLRHYAHREKGSYTPRAAIESLPPTRNRPA